MICPNVIVPLDSMRTSGLDDGCLYLVSGSEMDLTPVSSFILMIIPVVLYFNQILLIDFGLMGNWTVNPFEWMLVPSYRLPNGKYTKGWKDFIFIAYHIIFWSFIRQFVTLHILRPLARRLGIRGNKIMRFTEQGYAIFYFGIMGIAGIVSQLR